MQEIISLEPNKYYNIYNQEVDKNNVFANNGNYTYFQEKYAQYIPLIADTFAYCLA